MLATAGMYRSYSMKEPLYWGQEGNGSDIQAAIQVAPMDDGNFNSDLLMLTFSELSKSRSS